MHEEHMGGRAHEGDEGGETTAGDLVQPFGPTLRRRSASACPRAGRDRLSSRRGRAWSGRVDEPLAMRCATDSRGPVATHCCVHWGSARVRGLRRGRRGHRDPSGAAKPKTCGLRSGRSSPATSWNRSVGPSAQVGNPKNVPLRMRKGCGRALTSSRPGRGDGHDRRLSWIRHACVSRLRRRAGTLTTPRTRWCGAAPRRQSARCAFKGRRLRARGQRRSSRVAGRA